jgi:DNA-directed RNA polymerase sigma subunit (sigma70/sigma32)
MSQLHVEDEGAMTFKEIADELGMSMEGVRQCYMRAIVKLRSDPRIDELRAMSIYKQRIRWFGEY